MNAFVQWIKGYKASAWLLVGCGLCIVFILWSRMALLKEERALSRQIQEYAWVQKFTADWGNEKEGVPLLKQYAREMVFADGVQIVVKSAEKVEGLLTAIGGSGCKISSWSVLKKQEGWLVQIGCHNLEAWRASLSALQR